MIGSPRKRLPKAMVALYDQFRFEFASLRHRKLRGSRSFSFPDQRFLNLGCGPDPIGQYDGFLNADHYRFSGEVDFCLDLRDPLPFPDHEWEGILLHHVLEHLPRESVPGFLLECRRVLQPGGVLRIAVPDCGLAARLYAAGESGDKAAEDQLLHLLPPFLGSFHEPMDVLNEFFHSTPENRHHAGYDTRALQAVLAAAGFSRSEPKPFTESLVPELAVGHQPWSPFTLYVDATS